MSEILNIQSNPFADYGGHISEDRFIGREYELRVIRDRIFGDRAYGSIAIVGLPRIGKSSLICESLRRATAKFDPLRIISVTIDVGSFSTANELFISLVSNLLEEARLKNLSTPVIEQRADQLRNSLSIDFDSVRKFFEALRQHNIRAVCVLDEFDAGRYIFADHSQCFHWLRGLCSDPKYKAAMVLISKRELQNISCLAGHDSNYWANVLTTINLRGFDEGESNVFFEKLKGNGIKLNEEIRAELLVTCGGHPYLLDAFGFFIFEHTFASTPIQLGDIQKIVSRLLPEYFGQVTKILSDGSALSKVIQILLGPQYDVTVDDVDRWIDYGVLHRNKQGDVIPFVDSFRQYLHVIESRIDIWPLWRDTERLLREKLDTKLQAKFGLSWPDKVKKSNGKVKPILESCEDNMKKEIERFGSQASNNVLAYTYPKQLFEIMTIDWVELGQALLGRDKNHWAVKFDLLAKARTPLAHNREEAITSAEKTQVEGICKEILGLLKN